MAYQAIENYGVIGNMRTVALVGVDGSIDWFCFPSFDSPSVFAAILDNRQGGRFSIEPLGDGITYKQMYWPDTNVLVTRFLSETAVGEIVDFMPLGEKLTEDHHHQLVRRLRVVRGEMRFRVACAPAFNYARDTHTVTIDDDGAVFASQSLALRLATETPLIADGAAATAEITLREGDEATFSLRHAGFESDNRPSLSKEEAEQLFQATVRYWRNWLSQTTYHGRWREIVYRSALVMKLLTYAPTGAIVAAPTTSLPEAIGGTRNWDYRYTWLRDAAFTLYGFMRIGFTEEAAAFMDWIEKRCHERGSDGSLQVMYGIHGEHKLTEIELEHLEGYEGSKPVRIGNGAYNQLQLDIYGELMDSVYLYNKYGTPISYDLWVELSELLEWVCDHWQDKDYGIWEVRGGPQHFVYSKLMCWVALDRGLRLADKRSFPANRGRWLACRDEIYLDIMANGWNEQLQSFVQYYGSESLDASLLIMPLVFFMSPTDPRMSSTLEAITRPHNEGGLLSDSLVYRYDHEDEVDGIAEIEGTFNMCTFWLVEALTRAGRVDEARLMFERMLSYANHLGLFAEETGPAGEALGNFPQAFTHLALISAAFNLDRVLGEGA